MVAKAPRKNASSRSRRAHHENWFINLLVHFSVFWEAQCHSPFAMALNSAMGFRRIQKLPPIQRGRSGKAASKVFLMIMAKVVIGQ